MIMQSNHNSQESKHILLLFPWRGLGEATIWQLLEKSYQIYLILQSSDDKNYFENKFQSQSDLLNIYLLQDEPALFWRQLSQADSEVIRQPYLVFNFIGKDFLTMNVEGEGEKWNIDLSEPSHLRFAFTDLLLNHFPPNIQCTWINLVYGAAGHTGKKNIFCQTRYTIMGFTNLVKMNPLLGNVEMINVCLTYLKHRDKADRVTHCTHCVAEKYQDELIHLDTPEKIASFLIRKGEELVEARGV